MPEADPPLAENRPFRSSSRRGGRKGGSAFALPPADLPAEASAQAGPSDFGPDIFKQTPQVPKLNDNQLKQLADFLSNLGVVFFGVGITPLFSDIDMVNIFKIVLSLIASVTSLIGSLSLLKK